MSLIKCPECGKIFSDHAAHCPQCGIPTSEALQAIVSEPAPADGSAEAVTEHADTDATRQPAAEPRPQTPQQPYYRPGYPQPKPKKQNDILLYVLICVVIVLAIIVIAIFVHDKFGSANNDIFDEDSTTVVQTLPADTLPLMEEITPEPITPVITPVEEVAEELPDASETEEIQLTHDSTTTTTATEAKSEPVPDPIQPTETTEPTE